MFARRISRGGSSGFPASTRRAMLYNGKASGNYSIGAASSTDTGATWTKNAANPVIVPSAGWKSTSVKDASLIWDGTKYVCYFTGSTGGYLVGTNTIGRATSTDLVTWAEDASNPVIGTGATEDAGGCSFPVVWYDNSDTPAWRMWYTGWASHTTETGTTICHADSTDGISWTKRGRVVNVGSAGAFDDEGCTPGCITKSGATWYLFYGGYDGALYKSAYVTFTAPTGTYTKQGQLSNLSGTITIAGRNWRSNSPRVVDGTRAYVSLWNPDDSSSYEMCASVTLPSLTSWPAPTTQIFTVPGSGWDANSAENPSLA